MEARDLICERCGGVVVPAYTPFKHEEVIQKRSKKGRTLSYCSDKCFSKHTHTMRH